MEAAEEDKCIGGLGEKCNCCGKQGHSEKSSRKKKREKQDSPADKKCCHNPEEDSPW